MSTLFFRDPRLLILTIALILAGGVTSFMTVPRMEDPVLTERAAIVNTRLPGADAQRVESLVTEEIVSALRSFDEIKELRSASRPGVSTVSIQLKDEIYEVEEVWARIRDELEDVRPRLVSTATPPDLKTIQARAYSVILALRWNDASPPVYSLLRRWTHDLEDVLRSVPNTEDVERFGDPTEEMLVEVDQERLTQLGLTIQQLSQQIAMSDAKVAAGKIHSPGSDLLIEVAGEFDSISRIQKVVVKSAASGESVYLSDLAKVTRTVSSPPRSQAIVDGKDAIIVGASVSPDARIDRWTKETDVRLAAFQKTLPPQLEMVSIFRQSEYVSKRMSKLVSDLIVSALSVVFIVWLMMGWTSALIVGSALPLASCIVFAALRFMGIPFHQMSLSGLVIALGMLEGAAIIIVDEVRRRMREGESRLDALKHGVAHMALPLFGATATTVISFMPIAIMPGPSGEFVGTIGTSVILALVAALGLSLTIIPTLAAFTRPSQSDHHHWFRDGFSSRRLSRLYEKSLRWAYRRRYLTAALGVLLAVPGFLVLPLFPIQFFPSADRSQFYLEMELSPQSSLQETASIATQVRARLLAHPEVLRVDWVLGESAPSFYYNMIGRVKDSPRYGQALIQVKSGTDPVTCIRELQHELDIANPEAQIRVRPLEQGPPFNAPLEIQIFGSDAETLRGIGEEVRQLLLQHPDVTHVQTDLTDQLPKVVLNIKEEEARLAGVELSSIARQLDAALEGRVGGSVLEGTEELPVRVRLANQSRTNVTAINAIDLLPDAMGAQGRAAKPLSSLATMTLASEPALISRLNGESMNEVRAYLQAGVLPAQPLKWFKRQMAAGIVRLPPGYFIKYGGEASKRGEAIGQLMSQVTLLVAATVFVLVFSLRSFRASLVIVMVAVCSFGMAFLTLYVTGFPLGFTAIVGAMGMVGVAINDSMVVLSELRTDPKTKLGDFDAIVALIMRSSRHVLSTTFTVGCSFIPMILGGGTFWPPMAMVVVGGVFGATLTALYWIPAIHLINAPRS